MTDDQREPTGPAMTDEDRDLTGPAPEPRRPRPLVERLGMAAIAVFFAVLFAGLAAVSLASGEPFLAVMGAIGALMTAWVGILTLVRG
jgi:hypothetical protein